MHKSRHFIKGSSIALSIDNLLLFVINH